MSNFSTPITRITGGGTGTVNKITFNGVEFLPDPTGNVPIDYQGFSGAYADLTGKPVLFSGNYSDLVGAPVLAAVATSGAYADLTGTPVLAAVATSGSYNDLTEKPTIPAAQVNSDWNATTGVARILNKPTIPTVPTNVSAFTNDAGYLDAGDVAPVGLSGNYADLTNKPDLSPLATAIQNAANVGAGTSLFSGKAGTNLDFRTLRAGDNVTLSVNAQGEIVIASAGGGTVSGEANTSSSLGAGISIVAPKNGVDLPFRSLLSSAGLTWSQETSTVTLTLHSILQAWANLTLAADTLVYATGTGTLGTTPLTAFARTLLDDANAAAMQNTLALALVASSGSYADLSNKPDLSVYAPLNSPTFAGNPTAPTAAATDNNTTIATTAFVRAAMALFGMGSRHIVTDADLAPTGLSILNLNEATNIPAGTLGVVGWLDTDAELSYTGSKVQRLQTTSPVRTFIRTVGVTDWKEIWHTGNLVKQTSTTDTTPGAMMAVGAFGWNGGFTQGLSDANTVKPPGAYSLYNTANAPYDFGNLISFGWGADSRWVTEIAMQVSGSGLAYRSAQAGSWSFGNWNSIFHTGNFDPNTKQAKSLVNHTAGSRTLTLDDAWNYVRPGGSAAITITVPSNATVAFAINTEITIRAKGPLTILPAAGVGIDVPYGGSRVLAADMTVVLKKVATDAWDLIGQTVAA